MSQLLLGKVYYQEHFAGFLQEEPGQGMSFLYDASYLDLKYPPLSHTLPLQRDPHFNSYGLHPFFDNLVAEGWLENAQTRFLGKRNASRFDLLLAFGYDCAGAVSIRDPDPINLSNLFKDEKDMKESAAFKSRASLSGVQPKLAVVEQEGKYFPAKRQQLSTHIAKFPSSLHKDLIFNEYLTMAAFKTLLPEDKIVDFFVGEIDGIRELALIIKRFDREKGQRIHFEEFNQLLGKTSQAKYQGSYKEMSHFILHTKGCLPLENYRLYKRILAGLLMGNTDMHFKNFAMFHTPSGLRLTPSYDQVGATLYKYNSLALAINGAEDLLITKLKTKNIVALAHEFQLSREVLEMFLKQLAQNKEAAQEVIFSENVGNQQLKDNLIKQMDSRWNGIFASIGTALLKKP